MPDHPPGREAHDAYRASRKGTAAMMIVGLVAAEEAALH
jgi:hypothetical protein